MVGKRENPDSGAAKPAGKTPAVPEMALREGKPPSPPNPLFVRRGSGIMSPMTQRRPTGADNAGRKLVVGLGIRLSGEIKACERLVIEGTVEANLPDCRILEVAAPGLFKGEATVERCEIAGRFEGDLTVLESLLVRSGGLITGKLLYRNLAIERGGKINGTMEALPDHDGVAPSGDPAADPKGPRNS